MISSKLLFCPTQLFSFFNAFCKSSFDSLSLSLFEIHSPLNSSPSSFSKLVTSFLNRRKLSKQNQSFAFSFSVSLPLLILIYLFIELPYTAS